MAKKVNSTIELDTDDVLTDEELDHELGELDEDDIEGEDSEGRKRGRKVVSSYIQVTPTFRVGSDARQWKVYQLVSNKNGKEIYQPKSYLNSLNSCIQSIFETEVRTSSYESIEDLLNNIQTIKSQIKNSLEASGLDISSWKE